MKTQDRYRLRKLRRARNKTEQFYVEKISALKGSSASRNEILRLEHERGHEISIVEDEIDFIEGRALLSQAEKLRIPVSYDRWQQSETTGYRHLEPDYFVELRARVREEKRARSDAWERRIPMIGSLVAALTGLLGVAVAVLTVCKSAG